MKKIRRLGEIWTSVSRDTDAMLCQPSKEIIRIVSLCVNDSDAITGDLHEQIP